MQRNSSRTKNCVFSLCLLGEMLNVSRLRWNYTRTFLQSHNSLERLRITSLLCLKKNTQHTSRHTHKHPSIANAAANSISKSSHKMAKLICDWMRKQHKSDTCFSFVCTNTLKQISKTANQQQQYTNKRESERSERKKSSHTKRRSALCDWVVSESFSFI